MIDPLFHSQRTTKECALSSEYITAYVNKLAHLRKHFAAFVNYHTCSESFMAWKFTLFEAVVSPQLGLLHNRVGLIVITVNNAGDQPPAQT